MALSDKFLRQYERAGERLLGARFVMTRPLVDSKRGDCGPR